MQQHLDHALDLKVLRPLAKKYIWWETPDEALEFPRRVIAQVMNIGTFEDVSLLMDMVGADELRQVLRVAEAGQFDDRSWHYWHYRLGLTESDAAPPPLPVRAIPEVSL
jgi:hypothetical protein